MRVEVTLVNTVCSGQDGMTDGMMVLLKLTLKLAGIKASDNSAVT